MASESKSLTPPLGNFTIFLGVSIALHLFQFGLFSATFEVEAPQVARTDPITYSKITLRFPAEPTPIEKIKPKPVSKTQADLLPIAAPTWKPSAGTLPLSLPIKNFSASRIRPSESHSRRIKLSSATPLVGKSQNKVAPYTLSKGLKNREIRSTPALPAYPEWAERLGVELKLSVWLKVGPEGRVDRVSIIHSSGDSETDNTVIQFCKKMRFVRSLHANAGKMSWEFKLDRR